MDQADFLISIALISKERSATAIVHVTRGSWRLLRNTEYRKLR